MKRYAAVFQLAGAAVLSVGVGLYSTAAGLITAGLCAVVFGVALEGDA